LTPKSNLCTYLLLMEINLLKNNNNNKIKIKNKIYLSLWKANNLLKTLLFSMLMLILLLKKLEELLLEKETKLKIWQMNL
jgi:hypothetical protein